MPHGAGLSVLSWVVDSSPLGSGTRCLKPMSDIVTRQACLQIYLYPSWDMYLWHVELQKGHAWQNELL